MTCIPCFLAHEHCPWIDSDWGIEDWPKIEQGAKSKRIRAERDERAAGRSSGKGKKVAGPPKKKVDPKDKEAPSKKDPKRPRISDSKDEGGESSNVVESSDADRSPAVHGAEDVVAVRFRDLSRFEEAAKNSQLDVVTAEGMRMRLLSQKAREVSDMQFAQETFSLRTNYIDFLVGKLEKKAAEPELGVGEASGEIEMTIEGEAAQGAEEEELEGGDEDEAAKERGESVVA